MTCYFPVTLYMSRTVNPLTGKRSLVPMQDGFRDMPRKVACSRCIGCRLERSRQWAIRCVYEAQLHEANSFITLTYRDDQLIHGGNAYGTLYPRHLELFWKRLRKWYDKPIRYFACGEYGDKSHRPHYHACVFGLDFPDQKLWSSKGGINLYTSDALDRLWSHGMCTIGDVNFESAAYVARYIVKKRLGQDADSYLKEGIEPEFVRMSRRPGIASRWFDKFETDVFPHDSVSIRGGIKCRPPKYFFNRYSLTHPLTMEDVISRRMDEAAMKWRDSTPERLSVRYRVKTSQLSYLIRSL